MRVYLYAQASHACRFKKIQKQTITNERNEEKVQEFFCAAKQKLSLDKIRKKEEQKRKKKEKKKRKKREKKEEKKRKKKKKKKKEKKMYAIEIKTWW